MRTTGYIENNVLFGEDDWLFLWQGRQAQFDYLTGVLSPSKESVQSFVVNLEARRLICEARGLPNVHIVYPSKPVVMAKFLPEEIRSGVQSLFERHYAHALNPEVATVLYPRKALIEASMTDQVFSRQDTHMTGIGDATVAQRILKSLNHDHDVRAHMEEKTRSRKGDLADMVKISTQFPEKFLSPRQDRNHVFNNRPSLPGNTDNIIIAHNASSASSRRLLALGDSFLIGAITALLTFYHDILFVRSDLFQPELLDLFGPDDVITSNAERFLSHVRPDSKGESVVMRGYSRADYQPTADFSAALAAQLSARNYPAVYEEWAVRMAARTFANMGVAQLSSQLCNVPGAPEWLESTGNDPRILFSNVSMDDDRDYQLHISMESTVDGTAQLFSGRRNISFTEEFSVYNPIHVGLNEMIFDLPAEGRSRNLRFDPLNATGRLRLVTIKLIPNISPVQDPAR